LYIELMKCNIVLYKFILVNKNIKKKFIYKKNLN